MTINTPSHTAILKEKASHKIKSLYSYTWMNEWCFSLNARRRKNNNKKTLEYIIKQCWKSCEVLWYTFIQMLYVAITLSLKLFCRLGYHWIYHCNETVSINILEGTKIRTNIRASPGSKKCQQGNKCPISHDINDCTHCMSRLCMWSLWLLLYYCG